MTYEEYEKKVGAFLEKYPQDEYVTCTGDELGFSWRVCDCCQMPLGGDRHQLTFAHIKTDGDENNYVYEICRDCSIYIEYGHLDWWEGRINVK